MASNYQFPTVDYAQALAAVTKGLCVARLSWMTAGNYLFMSPADDLPISYLANVKSLPESVKRYLRMRAKNETYSPTGEEITVSFNAYLCLVVADLSIINGWVPAQLDMFATDWTIDRARQRPVRLLLGVPSTIDSRL
jgi:hypothetical protein